ncbi:hypothetical protein AB4480_08160 [Vibrio sp. 10N.261.45.A4]|uniref:hypothetical protein n=2 Tax=unclassified Vibrio TaxID=2614977 RepID=UPI003552B4CE
MELASRVIVKNKKLAHQHRKANPSGFEYLGAHPNGVCRYYSDAPAFRLGDALKAQLEKSGEAISNLIFFQPFSEQWYACAFEDGELIHEQLGALDELEREFAYQLHHSKHVLVADNAPHTDSTPSLSFYGDKQIVVPAMTQEDWLPFALAPVNRMGLRPLIGGVLLLVTLSVVALLNIDSQPTPIVESKSTESTEPTFEQAFAEKKLAYPMLMNALALSVEARTLPEPMGLTSIHFDGQQLVAKVDDGDVRSKVKRQWLSLTPRFNEAKRDNSEYVFDTPPTEGWQAFDVTGYRQDAIDALELLSAEVELRGIKRVAEIDVHTVRLTTTGKLGKLPVIASLLNAPFVTASELTLETDGENIKQFTLQIEIQGVSRDE